MWKKIVILTAAITLISYLHFTSVGRDLGLHLLHQELFFIPIMLGSFWFGIPAGLLLAAIVSLLYAPLMFAHGHGQGFNMELSYYTQICLYFAIAALLGWLSESRKKKEMEAARRKEAASIGRAAAAISYEIKDIAATLEKLFHQKSLGQNLEAREIDFELRRLNKLFDVLSKYNRKQGQLSLSTDLDAVVSTALAKTKDKAEEAEVTLRAEKAKEKCTTTAWAEPMETILIDLIYNAIEASTKHQAVRVRLHRDGANCIIEVVNQGNIAQEIADKLFKPFFSTKKNGLGLAIAGGRKILRDHGGNLQYKPAENSTIFQMTLPRESVRRTIEEIIDDKSTEQQ